MDGDGLLTTAAAGSTLARAGRGGVQASHRVRHQAADQGTASALPAPPAGLQAKPGLARARRPGWVAGPGGPPFPFRFRSGPGRALASNWSPIWALVLIRLKLPHRIPLRLAASAAGAASPVNGKTASNNGLRASRST